MAATINLDDLRGCSFNSSLGFLGGDASSSLGEPETRSAHPLQTGLRPMHYRFYYRFPMEELVQRLQMEEPLQGVAMEEPLQGLQMETTQQGVAMKELLQGLPLWFRV